MSVGDGKQVILVGISYKWGWLGEQHVDFILLI